MSSKSPEFPSAIAGLLNPELILSVATVPVLAGMLAGQAMAKSLQELGTISEEIFRGDRLPVLEFPSSEQSET